MKLLLTFVVVLVTFFAVSFADDCEIKGHKFNKGETFAPLGECIQYTCGGPGEFSALGCGESFAPNCKYVPEDLTKPYPECCPSYDC